MFYLGENKLTVKVDRYEPERLKYMSPVFDF